MTPPPNELAAQEANPQRIQEVKRMMESLVPKGSVGLPSFLSQ